MKNLTICLLVLSFALIIGPAYSEEPATGLPKEVVQVKNEKCPLTGEPVSEKISALINGKIYYFCCAGCIETFKKDPKSFQENLKDAKEITLKVTNKDGNCPITGKPAKLDIFLVRGETITFYCCPDCVGKDHLEPAKK